MKLKSDRSAYYFDLVNFNDTDATFCPTEFCLVKYSIRDKPIGPLHLEMQFIW